MILRPHSFPLLVALGLVPTIASAQPAPKVTRKPLGGVVQPQSGTTPAGTTATPAGSPPSTTTTPTTGTSGTSSSGTTGSSSGTSTSGSTAGKEGTDKLPQFEQAMGEFQPKNPNYKVSFSLEDADLTELVKVIGQLTGRRFIFGGKVRNIKASVYSPQKVTVAEAYQAFLSILETNGLTVIPHGRFLKIVESGGIAAQTTPVIRPNQAATGEDRYITRLHRMQNVSADEMATILGKFKSKDGDISVHSPSNLLIITDTGTNIRRMMSIVEEIDVGGAGDQVWMQPLHYATAGEVASRVNDLFDIKAGGAAPPKGAPAGSAGAAGASGGEYHVAKVLPDDRTNSVIVIATEKAYLRILELIKRIDVPQSAEGEVRVLPLQHADATELAKTLNDIVQGAAQAAQPAGGARPAGGAAPAAQGIFEGGVRVSADKSTNSIVVTSSPRDFASLRAVIDRLDKPRRQVFIEAVIMDLSVNRSNQLNMNFHGGSAEDVKTPNDTILYGGLNPVKSATQLTPLQDSTLLNGAALGIRGPAIPGTENLLGTGVSLPAFGLILNALATSGDTDVLSTPHILATDNVPAEINIGENIPLNTNLGLPGLGSVGGAGAAAGALGALGGLGGASSFGARQDVGTKIKITPHVNESNQVRLEIQEEISEAKEALPGSAGAIPIVKRTAQTQLVVGDQQTVVIGGLMRNRLVNSEAKIPLLGDIPVLGFLFRSSSSQMQKTNLILVLTPSIIRDQTDLRRIFERKMQERQEFLDRYFVFRENADYQPPKDYTRTSGLVEAIRQSFFQMDEKRRMDELLRPKELKTHAPTAPLEMPGGRAGPPHAAAAPATPAAAPAPINVTPPARNTVKEVEK